MPIPIWTFEYKYNIKKYFCQYFFFIFIIKLANIAGNLETRQDIKKMRWDDILAQMTKTFRLMDAEKIYISI
jgi:hypothetical protein